MNFRKEDLKCDHYYWKSDENTVYTGSPARRLFDPSNGEQVVFIINSYAAVSHDFLMEDGIEIEQLLKKELPLEAKSEISVLHWIQENYVRQLASLENKVS